MPGEMSEELKAAMGKPSTYHTGGPSAAAAPDESSTPDPKHVSGLVESLKGLLGIGKEKEARVGPQGKSVTDVVDDAVNGVKANPDTNEYP